MDPALTALIEDQLTRGRLMTVATVRADGWPQATVVGYLSEGLRVHFVISRQSQKFANLGRDPRASIAIGADHPGPIRGLSMAARVSEVVDPAEIERLNRLLIERWPEITVFAPPGHAVALMCAQPEVISVVDYTRGRGHVDQIVLVEGQWRPG